MINGIKAKYKSHFAYKITIFIISGIVIYLATGFALDCVGAIAYTGYYNINFTGLKGLQNIPALGVITNSAGVGGVVVLGMFLVYGNHKFDNGKPFDKKNKSKSIRINYNELAHQDLLIKGISQQNDILSYQTEKKLKAESYREKGYPDLLVHYENKTMIVELERTRKTKQRMRMKFDGLRPYVKSGYEVLFLVPNESMRKFIDEQIKIYNGKLATFKTEIFNR